QIASGMNHLASLGIVHRDLAARNVLVDMHQVCRLCDYGLAREGAVYMRAHARSMPIAWMSPEAISHGTFSQQSDVWAFGVVLYEIYSWGAQPYGGMGTEQVIDFVRNGRRLPAPVGTPDSAKQLMTRCWSARADERPTF
ncbi:uncharacterized protein MONBRDRAFT_3066, partial [Monosiga brevicollis MX1]